MKTTKALILLICTLPSIVIGGVFPDYGYRPPSDWIEPTFRLSQDYPDQIPNKQDYPWEKVDFRTAPEEYLQAVIDYCFEGNVEVDFNPEKNSTRKWYHAPWLHAGPNGREFVKGLTRERSSRPFELAQNQSETYRNYAVGFYNDRGAFAIGRVWKDSSKPDPKQAVFPEGSVSFKLLYTTAPESIASYLIGSPTWIADIDRSNSAAEVLKREVRLLQIDISVKDKRSDCGGWVFGTFHYDSTVSATNPWRKLRALSLTWGNDPKLTETMYLNGTKPEQSWVNALSPIAIYRNSVSAGGPAPRVFGLAGRANGPVDNPASSCLSCHGTAQIPASVPMIPQNGLSETQKLVWFRNLAPNESFSPRSVSLDFSLQLGVGIQNFNQANPLAPASGDRSLFSIFSRPKARAKDAREYIFSRDPE
jgi:hypothetical protein